MPQCYIPSLMVNSPLVPEKIFEGFFTIDLYGSSAATLVMGIRLYWEQSFTSPTHYCSTCNLALTGPAVMELFETNGHLYLSCVMRKPAFCICENKDADQLRGNLISVFVFTTKLVQCPFFLNLKFQASSL